MARTKKDKGSFRRRWLRRLGKLTLLGGLLAAGLWFAVHRVSWLGPAIADGIRSVVGPAPVAWLEDVAYGLQDRVNVWRYRGAAPKTFWQVPESLSSAPPVEAVRPGPPPYRPAPVSLPFPAVAAAGDGVWVPLADSAGAGAAPSAFKTIVHPDPRRSFAALAIVAVDIKAFEVHLMAGTREPVSYRVRRKDRPGLIPRAHHRQLFAAFNGGFKTTHGHYGMMLDGVEFVAPRTIACTFAHYRDGSFAIGTWSAIMAGRERMKYYRQSPPCLAEGGKIHKLLRYHEYAKGWGATVSGDTVIRRSAIGLDREGQTLFYGLGESMTAQSLAKGMLAAGAHGVAELDVNHSYPRMLFYEWPAGSAQPLATSAIIEVIEYSKYQYAGQASTRDFFYLTHRGETEARLPGRTNELAVSEP